MVTEVAQELLEVLGRLWERAHESRISNWPSYIQMVQGKFEPELGCVDFKLMGFERKFKLPAARVKRGMTGDWQGFVDSLAAELWLARADLANDMTRAGVVTLPRYRAKDLEMVHPDAERQIYQIPTDAFPHAGAVFWTNGQALVLTLMPDDMVRLSGCCYVGHGRPSKMLELRPYDGHPLVPGRMLNEAPAPPGLVVGNFEGLDAFLQSLPPEEPLPMLRSDGRLSIDTTPFEEDQDDSDEPLAEPSIE